MHVLAGVAGVPLLGALIDIGVLVSLFAGTLACITAAARVLLLMAHNGLAHRSLRITHARNETPSRAILVTGIAAVPARRGARGARGERARRLRLDGLPGNVRLHRHLCAGCIALPALFAPARCLPSQSGA